LIGAEARLELGSFITPLWMDQILIGENQDNWQLGIKIKAFFSFSFFSESFG
jgi:hypothetical protein